MRTLPSLLLAFSFAAIGCVDTTQDELASSTSRPLINGEIDQGDEAVVALLLSNGFPFCTGTLVSPSVILTAAHCIDDAGGDPAIAAFFGTDAYGEGRKVAVAGAIAHLGWNGNIGSDDIAMMRLQFPQDPSMAIPMQSTPPVVNDPVRRVGFGIYNQSGDSDGQKRVGDTTLTRLQSDVFITGGPGANTCSGDSGGPGFITGDDGVEYIAGVHSFGSQINDVCQTGNDGDTRVDLFLNDFILPWIQENDPVCGLDQVCGYIGCTNDPDCTPCGPDGQCIEDCALPDPDCTTQAVGEICQVRSQCLSDLCVFYPGDPNYHFCTEECDKANDTCPTGMECQTVAGQDICNFVDDPPGILGDECSAPTDCGSYVCEQSTCVYECDLSAGQGCPEGFECSSIDGNQNYYCHAVEGGGGGGCNSAGGTSGALWLMLLGIAVLWRRRRISS